MEPYCADAAADVFAAAIRTFNCLLRQLAGPQAVSWTHDRLEEVIEQQGRELLRLLLQARLDLRALREQDAVAEAGIGRAAVVGADGLPRRRVEMRHHRLLATVFGTVTVTRCAWRAPGLPNVYPADMALSLPAGRHSHGLARLAVAEAVRGSFDAAHAAITARCGNVLGKRQLQRLAQTAAVDIDAFYQQRTPVPRTREELLVLSCDAKGVVMRPEAFRLATAKAAARATRTFRTRLAAGQKSCRKRMATLGALYDAEPARRRPHDVVALPGGRTGERRPRPGPHASGKWLCSSVINDPDEVIAALFDQAEARDPRHARVWVVLVDGARHQLDLIRAEAIRRSVAINIVIDFIHVIKKLWAGAWCLHRPADPAAEDWVATHALALLAGHTREVITDLDTQAAQLPADRREGIDTCIRYLTDHAEFLRYDQALAAG